MRAHGKVALTGATGFIGNNLAKQLRDAGWQVRALVRPSSNTRVLDHLGVEQVKGTVEDVDTLRHLVAGAYAIVHCAGAVRGITPADFNRVNVEGSAHLVQAAREQDPPPRLLALSSLAAREPNLSPYAASKRQGEEAFSTLDGRMEWVVLRPPAVYGPRDQEMLPLLQSMAKGIAPILGSRAARFSLLYVEDLSGVILQWLERGMCESGTFELHDGRQGGYTWNDVVNIAQTFRGKRILRVRVPHRALKILAALNMLAARSLGYAPMLTLGKVRELRHSNWVCDNAVLNRALGWEPKILFEEGLRRTLRST